MKMTKNRIKEYYFGMGIELNLLLQDGVFEPSPAGIHLCNYIVENIHCHELEKPILELGTGTGLMALLLAKLGGKNILATDIEKNAVNLACKNNERFEKDMTLTGCPMPAIKYKESNLFEALEEALHGLVVFNPPGWRTPSDKDYVKKMSGTMYYTMFEGDQVVLRFLQQLHNFLLEDGRALIGLNSVMGISDVFQKYYQWERDNPVKYTLQFSLKSKKRFKLFLYDDAWKNNFILDQLHEWRKAGKSYFEESENQLYWFYEIIEIRKVRK